MPPSLASVVHTWAAGDLWALHVVSLKYIGMIYINVGEMCFILINVHVEHSSMCSMVFVSTGGSTFRLLFQHFYIYQAVILLFMEHFIVPPSFPLFLSICFSLSVVPHPVFLISGCGSEMLMFSSCHPIYQSSLQLDTFTIQWTHPVVISTLIQ